MNLEEATWTDVDAVETDLALLPTGSTEQHGPHAPLGTDRIAAEAVAEAGAATYEDQRGDPVVVAPPIPVGVSAEHRTFAGSLWVSEDTFRSYVRETVASLAHHGFDRVVLVNGHGGNVDALREVAGRITREDDAYAVPFTWFEHVGEDAPPMGHAGGRETSLLRAVTPETVREGRIEAARDGGSERWGEWVEGVNLAYDVEEFSENGVVGDPTEGSEAVGEQLLSTAAGSLSRLLAAVAKR
jgi:creatinine amidohydrolase